MFTEKITELSRGSFQSSNLIGRKDVKYIVPRPNPTLTPVAAWWIRLELWKLL